MENTDNKSILHVVDTSQGIFIFIFSFSLCNRPLSKLQTCYQTILQIGKLRLEFIFNITCKQIQPDLKCKLPQPTSHHSFFLKDTDSEYIVFIHSLLPIYLFGHTIPTQVALYFISFEVFLDNTSDASVCPFWQLLCALDPHR